MSQNLENVSLMKDTVLIKRLSAKDYHKNLNKSNTNLDLDDEIDYKYAVGMVVKSNDENISISDHIYFKEAANEYVQLNGKDFQVVPSRREDGIIILIIKNK